MRAGEEATIHCPNDLDLGGGIKNEWHSTYGTAWIDDTVDTKYVLSISECSLHPASFGVTPDIETLSTGFPF